MSVSTSVRSSGFNFGFPSKKHALKRSAKRLLSFQKFFRMVSGVILLFTFYFCHMRIVPPLSDTNGQALI